MTVTEAGSPWRLGKGVEAGGWAAALSKAVVGEV